MDNSKTRQEKRRDELLPAIVAVFAEHGYRGATTAELARRCQCQETILYRLWTDKKGMFLDAVEYVAENNLRIWRELLRDKEAAEGGVSAIVAYESRHLGEFGNHRIVFSALSETDDPQIREALQRMYWRIHAFLVEQLASSGICDGDSGLSIECLAWSLVGLGTIGTILGEIGVLGTTGKETFLREAGRALLKT